MKPKPVFGIKKCLEITGDAQCEQYQCTNPATCLSRVSGFVVYTCKAHHVCDRGNEEAIERHLESIHGKMVKDFNPRCEEPEPEEVFEDTDMVD